jgi:hypothetical protein
MLPRIQNWLENRWGYLRFVDNWHKHPVVSKLLCKVGRHDYEFMKAEERPNGEIYGHLECFYCESKRISIRNPAWRD